MKLHIVHNAKDHNILTVHLDVNLYNYKAKREKEWKDSDCFDDFDDFETEPSPYSPAFRNHLLQIKGVQRVAFDKYSIDITKGEVFRWKVLVEQIRASLELDLNDGNLATYTGAYRTVRHPLVSFQKKPTRVVVD